MFLESPAGYKQHPRGWEVALAPEDERALLDAVAAEYGPLLITHYNPFTNGGRLCIGRSLDDFPPNHQGKNWSSYSGKMKVHIEEEGTPLVTELKHMNPPSNGKYVYYPSDLEFTLIQ